MLKLKSQFEGATERKHTDGRTVYKARGTSLTLDRYQEVVIPRGMIADAFMENPVLLNGHDYKAPPIGTILDFDITDTDIVFSFVFDDADPDARMLEAKYNNGTMRTFSIGFIPRKFVTKEDYTDEDGKAMTDFEVNLPKGEKQKIDISQFRVIPRYMYTAWEMLELSTVSVPANPDATLLQLARDLATENDVRHPEIADFMHSEMNEEVENLVASLKTFTNKYADYKLEGAVSTHSTPVVEQGWDGSKARTALAKWASSDNSGSKDKISWSKFAKGFGWFKNDSPNNLTSYKLPHHTVKDGSLVAVWAGVTAAMAALLGARGGTEVGDDGKKVYNHLARHYRDHDSEPPEYGKDYDEAELKEIEDGTWTPEAKGTVDDASSDSDADASKVTPPTDDSGETITGLLTGIAESLVELHIKQDMTHELVVDINDAGERSAASKKDVDPVEPVDKDLAKALKDFVSPENDNPTAGE